MACAPDAAVLLGVLLLAGVFSACVCVNMCRAGDRGEKASARDDMEVAVELVGPRVVVWGWEAVLALDVAGRERESERSAGIRDSGVFRMGEGCLYGFEPSLHADGAERVCGSACWCLECAGRGAAFVGLLC